MSKNILYFLLKMLDNNFPNMYNNDETYFGMIFCIKYHENFMKVGIIMIKFEFKGFTEAELTKHVEGHRFRGPLSEVTQKTWTISFAYITTTITKIIFQKGTPSGNIFISRDRQTKLGWNLEGTTLTVTTLKLPKICRPAIWEFGKAIDDNTGVK